MHLFINILLIVAIFLYINNGETCFLPLMCSKEMYLPKYSLSKLSRSIFFCHTHMFLFCTGSQGDFNVAKGSTVKSYHNAIHVNQKLICVECQVQILKD